MKNKFLLIVVLCIASVCNAQDEDPLLPDALSETGTSINLYTIELENTKIPISLNYNSTGIKVNDVPSPLGFSWKLNDIGKITRIVNHYPDEYVFDANYIDEIEEHTPSNLQSLIPYINGWFFSKDNDPNGYLGEYSSYGTYDVPPFFTATTAPKFYSKYVDSSPDYFLLQTATGLNSTFVYKKNFDGSGNLLNPSPVMLDTNENLLITTNFNNFHYNVSNATDIVFDIKTENAQKYSFIGGPVMASINRSGIDGPTKKDFYLKQITSEQNSDVVTINYAENLTHQFHYFESGRTLDQGEVITISSDYGFDKNGTLEVSQIITPKETIDFTYTDVQIATSTNYSGQSVKQLTRLEIKNSAGEFVTGYNFYYQMSANGFLLTRIDKINQITQTEMQLWDFEYYPGTPNSPESADYDMYGYSIKRQGSNTTTFLHDYKVCHFALIHQGADKSPHFEGILPGMLKKTTNNLGGTKEFTYTLNASNADHNEYYGGGLKIASITETPAEGKSKTTNFTYQQIKGRVYNLVPNKIEFEGYMPNTVYKFVSNAPMTPTDTDVPNPSLFTDYKTQVVGNYFQYVKSSTFYEVEDGLNVYLETYYQYDPYWKGVISRPLLKKKTIAKGYYYPDNSPTGIVRLSEEERFYDLFYSDVVSAREIKGHSFNMNSCGNDYHMYSTFSIKKKPLYVVQQPLKTVITKEYKPDDLGLQTSIVETKTQFKYIGEGAGGYTFDDLLPKEITTYKNNLPVGKKKFTYLFEMFSPTAGLSNLSQYSTQGFTLSSEDSQWAFNNTSNKWMLREANFYEYNADGKVRGTFKVHKNQSTNTFYDESNYTPSYNAGSITGVSRENEVTLNYDINGKVAYITDFENGKVTMFSRLRDKDPYSVNTILVGNRYLLSSYDFYRNSFEGSTSSILTTPLAYTGTKVYTANTLKIATYPAGYIVSFWYYKNSKWQFSSIIHTGGLVTISKPSGAVFIDEVWVRPPSTVLTGFTFEPLIGATSVIDDTGLVVKTIYDEFGREIKQADQDNNLLLKKEYNLTND